MFMNERILTAATANFEAARHVTILPQNHRSRRIHGHSFLAKVCAAVPRGWGNFPGGEVGELRAHLTACLVPLDYRDLKRELEQPTDENLARWVRRRLAVPGIETVGIQSTAHEG